jgi:hypothetical protein
VNQPAIPAGPAPVQYSSSDLIQKYIQLRDKKAEIEAAHKAKMAPFNEAMGMIETLLGSQMMASGLQSLRADAGTSFFTTRNSYSVEDPAAFRAWAVGTGNQHLYENRVSKDAVETYVQQTGTLPPGLKANSETRVTVRK